jgi:uncharacterized membrane protein
MNIPSSLLPSYWYWSAAVLYLLMLANAAWRAPWARLKEESQLHVYLGTCVGLMLMWTIKTPILPGLEYHYLGATLLTLMFGWQLGAVGMSVVLAGTVLSGAADWLSYPLNAIIMGFVPVTVANGVLRLTERYLPANFFIYVFVVGYWGAAAAAGAVVLSGATVVWLGAAYTLEQLFDQYVPLLVMLMVPEAFITCLLVTLMVVYRPNWVGTFDDKRYIRGK